MPSQEEEHRLAELLERARKIEQSGGGRKHHLVPSSYLHRWAEDGQVRVTDVEAPHTYCGRPETVGRVTDFYRLEADGIEKEDLPPLALEVLLSEIEGRAKAGIDELVAREACSPENGAYLAWFIALQATRGRGFRATMRQAASELLKLQVADMDEHGVRLLLGKNGEPVTDRAVTATMNSLEKVTSGEWTVAPQDAALAGLAAQTAGDLVEYLLLGRHWCVYDTPELLVTCDEPLVIVGGPKGKRAEQGGLATAPVLLFPLAPSKLLVLLRTDLEPEQVRSLNTLELADVNRELIANSTRWVFEKPSRQIGMRIRLPGPQPPLVNEHHQGSQAEGHVVYRQYQPTRWAAAPHTPWPVTRWWTTWA